jgi:hypothetical protein
MVLRISGIFANLSIGGARPALPHRVGLSGAAGLTAHLAHPLLILDEFSAGDPNRLHVTHFGGLSGSAALNE